MVVFQHSKKLDGKDNHLVKKHLAPNTISSFHAIWKAPRIPREDEKDVM